MQSMYKTKSVCTVGRYKIQSSITKLIFRLDNLTVSSIFSLISAFLFASEVQQIIMFYNQLFLANNS